MVCDSCCTLRQGTGFSSLILIRESVARMRKQMLKSFVASPPKRWSGSRTACATASHTRHYCQSGSPLPPFQRLCCLLALSLQAHGTADKNPQPCFVSQLSAGEGQGRLWRARLHSPCCFSNTFAPILAALQAVIKPIPSILNSARTGEGKAL